MSKKIVVLTGSPRKNGNSSVGEVAIPGIYQAGAVHQTDGVIQSAKLADLI